MHITRTWAPKSRISKYYAFTYSVTKVNLDSGKNMLSLKNSQFLPNQYETWSKLACIVHTCSGRSFPSVAFKCFKPRWSSAVKTCIQSISLRCFEPIRNLPLVTHFLVVFCLVRYFGEFFQFERSCIRNSESILISCYPPACTLDFVHIFGEITPNTCKQFEA